MTAALDRANGNSESLADDPTYRKAADGLPGSSVADAYASASGLRRLLVPQGDALGTLSVLLDQPGLHDVLDRVRALGLELVEIKQAPD